MADLPWQVWNKEGVYRAAAFDLPLVAAIVRNLGTGAHVRYGDRSGIVVWIEGKTGYGRAGEDVNAFAKHCLDTVFHWQHVRRLRFNERRRNRRKRNGKARRKP